MREKESQQTCRMAEAGKASHSSLFRAPFTNGTVEMVMMTDQGSDVSIISKPLRNMFRKELPHCKVNILVTEPKYQ